ncbi:MAG: hypothetical protein HY961_17565 [Ignavibacteriae bacterium]|nr:hypothetical protein [Ignavibacteriota bacterium]
MKHRLTTVLILSLLLMGTLYTGGMRVSVKPENATSEVLLVNAGKIRPYYPLSIRKTSVILVKGPGELRIMTRARFTPKTKGLLNYRVAYKIDGGDEHLLDVSDVKRSNDASFKDEELGIPGDSHPLALRLGRGYHSIEFALRDSLPKVLARYLWAPGKEVKMKWIELEPVKPYSPVELLAKEEIASYYRFSAQQPLKVEVIGPTEVRLLTRVENSYNMQGEANYRIQLRQYGSVVRTYQLSSMRSETTTYRDSSKYVAGKAREIVFKVPQGKNVYEIAPLENVSILGCMRIPEQDVDLEE